MIISLMDPHDGWISTIEQLIIKSNEYNRSAIVMNVSISLFDYLDSDVCLH